MATVGEMKARFELFIANMEHIATDIIQASEKQVIELIHGQLMQGKDGKDVYLKPYYDHEYAEFKMSLNPLGVTDLKLTGSFWRNMYMIWISDTNFVIYSKDSKAASLFEKYGASITELNDANIESFFLNRWRPLFMKQLSDTTGAGLG